MKYQLALDAISVADARTLIERLRDRIDLVEVGTPFVLQEGLDVIAELRPLLGSAAVVADIKIMDGGEFLSAMAFDAGADYVTVLAAARDETILAAVRKANQVGKRVFVDLIAMPDAAARALAVRQLGVHGVCVHSGFEPGSDEQADVLAAVRSAVPDIEVAVAGGVSAATIGELALLEPDIAVVGSAITSAIDPSAALTAIRRAAGRRGR